MPFQTEQHDSNEGGMSRLEFAYRQATWRILKAATPKKQASALVGISALLTAARMFSLKPTRIFDVVGGLGGLVILIKTVAEDDSLDDEAILAQLEEVLPDDKLQQLLEGHVSLLAFLVRTEEWQSLFMFVETQGLDGAATAAKLEEGLPNIGLDVKAYLLLQRGQYEEAEQLLRANFKVFERMGDVRGLAANQVNLARLLMERGQYTEAEQLLRASLHVFESIGDIRGVANTQFYLKLLVENLRNFKRVDNLLLVRQEFEEQVDYPDHKAEIPLEESTGTPDPHGATERGQDPAPPDIEGTARSIEEVAGGGNGGDDDDYAHSGSTGRSMSMSVTHPAHMAQGTDSSFIAAIGALEIQESVEAAARQRLRSSLDASEEGNLDEMPSRSFDFETAFDLVTVRLESNHINIRPEEGVTLRIPDSDQITTTEFIGSPKPNAPIGTRVLVRMSLTEKQSGAELVSDSLSVIVDDYLVGKLPRPLANRVISVVTGFAGLAVWVLTFLEQIDSTFGLVAGAASFALAAVLGLTSFIKYRSNQTTTAPPTP